MWWQKPSASRPHCNRLPTSSLWPRLKGRLDASTTARSCCNACHCPRLQPQQATDETKEQLSTLTRLHQSHREVPPSPSIREDPTSNRRLVSLHDRKVRRPARLSPCRYRKPTLHPGPTANGVGRIPEPRAHQRSPSSPSSLFLTRNERLLNGHCQNHVFRKWQQGGSRYEEE